MATCHLRPKLVEPKDGRKIQVLLYFSDQFLKEDQFYPHGANYFMFWSCLITIELITEVQEVETSFRHQRALYEAQVIVEEEQQGKEVELKVRHSFFYLLDYISRRTLILENQKIEIKITSLIKYCQDMTEIVTYIVFIKQ